MKKHAPATLRNREAIAPILAEELPQTGTVLEIASGSGEHAVFFANRFPQLIWQPSDPDPEALASIASYQKEYAGRNLAEPVRLNAGEPRNWPVVDAQAIVCINMVHISEWEATIGLFTGCSTYLTGEAPIILYGPYLEDIVETAPSNLAFDRSLKERNPAWGLRSVSEVDSAAAEHGYMRSKRYDMPANNLTLVYRKRSACGV